MYHGAGGSEPGEPPIIKVVKEYNQFVIFHCQRMLPVLYDANDWLRQAREHPSFRVVVQTLSISKRYVGKELIYFDRAGPSGFVTRTHTHIFIVLVSTGVHLAINPSQPNVDSDPVHVCCHLMEEAWWVLLGCVPV